MAALAVEGFEGWANDASRHPLDPLNAAEVEAATAAVARARKSPGPATIAADVSEATLARLAPCWRLPSGAEDKGGAAHVETSGVPASDAFASLPKAVTTRWVTVVLAEPLKSVIVALRSTAATAALPPRVALVQFVEVYARSLRPTEAARRPAGPQPPTGASFEGLVLLHDPSAVTADGAAQPRVLAMRRIMRGQPAMSESEYEEVEALMKRDPRFAAAMARRGITDMSLVICDPWCVGLPSADEDSPPAGRLSRPIFWVMSDPDDDMGYAQPVVNVEAVVDLYTMTVLSVTDLGVVPVPDAGPMKHWRRERVAEAAAARGAAAGSGSAGTVEAMWAARGVKPLEVVQARGPSWSVRGNRITWQRWSMRVGFTSQEGLVLHTVGYADPLRGGATRPIAYRLSFAEMIVPYGDPRSPHNRKNAFDAGEDGLGRNVHSLTLGCDCLGDIHYFDATVVAANGTARVVRNAICLHEEDNGMLWKHKDWRDDSTEVRRARRLVVSFICTVANYEYAFYWYFYQSGDIEAEVKLSGVLSTGAEAPGKEGDAPWGTMIAPTGLYAPVHQHFWVVRMDMAVDGIRNSVAEVEVRADPGPSKVNPHCGAFRSVVTPLESELRAARDVSHTNSRSWVVFNPRSHNRMGAPTAWKLIPGGNAAYAGLESSSLLTRAGFLRHHFWATQYAGDEQYPAGPYPNQNTDEGIAVTSRRDASLVAQDVVLWYLFGITHVPRLEDWPIVSLERIGFRLSPNGFFDAAPDMDVPPQEYTNGRVNGGGAAGMHSKSTHGACGGCADRGGACGGCASHSGGCTCSGGSAGQCGACAQAGSGAGAGGELAPPRPKL